MITLRNLHKYFNKSKQNEIHVLNDVSLSLPEKGMVAIFGRSGCGKTTLLNVIGGLDGFSGGHLSVDGADIQKDADLIRNRSMGYIFQNYNLHKDRTCHDNVADALLLCGMKDREEINRRVRAALSAVDMAHFGARTPDTLSGGQQQRIAIARAIVKNPRILLADEPTGNLDEANTLMIMNLLKELSRDHLVLLVTHEAYLVDHFCDTVIELKDGRVEGIRQNDNAVGMVAKSKNAIYLGELEKTEMRTPEAQIDYYGEPPAEPLALRIVNKDGRLYVQITTPDVRILDDSSELRLCEGVFNETPDKETAKNELDLSELPPFEGKAFGKLFHWGASIKSGYNANFKKQKRGKRFLRACLCLFAAVTVFATAVFGTVFGDIIEINESYSHNTFYLYTPNGQVFDRLSSAMESGDYGIDAMYVSPTVPSGDSYVKFITGYFETFSTAYYDESFSANAVYLPFSLAESGDLLAGNRDDSDSTAILITSSLADALLETSSVGYITSYRDLIGLTANGMNIGGSSARIAGVVKGEEKAVYASRLYFEENALSHISNLTLATDYGLTAKEGEIVLAIRSRSEGVTYPKVGETLQIHGKELKVAEILEAPGEFSEWMQRTKGITATFAYDYFRELAEKEPLPKPLPEGMEAEGYYSMLTEELYREGRFEYMGSLAAYLDEYIRLRLLFEEDYMLSYLYNTLGVEEYIYTFLPEGNEYYRGLRFKELYGRFPDLHNPDDGERLEEIPDLYTVLEPYYQQSSFTPDYSHKTFTEQVTLLANPGDYASLAYRYGESTPLLRYTSTSFNYYQDKDMYGNSIMVDMEIGYAPSAGSETPPAMYTVIHTTDPDATDALLGEIAASLTAPYENAPVSLTPTDLYNRQMDENGETVLRGIVTIGAVLVLLCVCMYFIMRSALMSRIKEVGIYRAIGVSRKNLCFRFLVESLVLSTLTVFAGYLGSSILVRMLLSSSSLMSGMLFYPLWLAAAVLLLLYGLSLLCGTLPVLSLMRKSPSAILAKYDI